MTTNEAKLLKACVQLLDYVEMTLAHTGSQTVAEIEQALARVKQSTSSVSTAHHLGCAKTTRTVDLDAARQAIASYQ
jgi:hypothetical protein